MEISFNLHSAQNHLLQALLNFFYDSFAPSSMLKRTALVKHRIITDEGERPVRQRPYRVSLKEREEIYGHVKKMLRHVVIEPPSSPRAQAVVLVEKKTVISAFALITAS